MPLVSCYRTHTCGELRSTDCEKEATLSGWIMRKRDHGGIIFLDLRDHYGVTQVVASGEIATKLEALRIESVITVKGVVKKRENALVNAKIPTGEIEFHCSEFKVVSSAQVLPFQIADDDNAPEPTRLTYRFLDLRREKVHNNIVLRSKVIQAFRDAMQKEGFLEYQTPILTSSSPEGARDFLVPSRFHPGKFFALPQAPQQFKQLLMVSGFDRYFQIAPCFRDEDPRADRSPGEFYQLDMEMSFVEQEDVFKVGEQVMSEVFKKFSSWTVPAPFPRIPYDESLSKYGTDKPDLRNPLTLSDVSRVFKESSFKVFQGALSAGGKISAIAQPVKEIPARKYFDDTVEYFTKMSGTGLAYLVFEPEGFKGSIAKFISEAEQAELRKELKIEGPTVVWLAAGPKKMLFNLGRLRTKLGDDFSLLEKDAYRFCWITDFPMFEIDEETGALVFAHNPFSMPQGGMEALNTKDPLDIKAWQYDIVCNGYELSSGAIRNHEPEIMYKAFSLVGYDQAAVEAKFGGMIKAFQFGAPPHGGMAPGIDRIVMLLAQESAIRDVIAFPLAQSVEDLLMSAPSEVSEKQLRELHIRVVKPEPKKEN